MIEFEKLDPETRCYALVGQFLQAWSVMENSLHEAIGAAMAIESTKLQILCANMRFSDKAHILATLVDVAPGFEDQKKEEIRKRLRSLRDYSATRNMVAHNPFTSDGSKIGVEFLTVKAKGKFDMPTIVWSVDQFQTEGATVDQYRAYLDEIAASFRIQPLPRQNYTAALPQYRLETDAGHYGFEYGSSRLLPSQPAMPLVLRDHLSRQAQDDPHSDPATPETPSQTPDKPHRK